MVLADIERALASLAANPYDQGLQLTDVSERVLSGLLALAGIATENMVRDPGWYMLDSGRGLERALQILALLRVTICQERAAEIDDIVLEAVLTAAESIVTFRRRYSTRARVDALQLESHRTGIERIDHQQLEQLLDTGPTAIAAPEGDD